MQAEKLWKYIHIIDTSAVGELLRQLIVYYRIAWISRKIYTVPLCLATVSSVPLLFEPVL